MFCGEGTSCKAIAKAKAIELKRFRTPIKAHLNFFLQGPGANFVI